MQIVNGRKVSKMRWVPFGDLTIVARQQCFINLGPILENVLHLTFRAENNVNIFRPDLEQ